MDKKELEKMETEISKAPSNYVSLATSSIPIIESSYIGKDAIIVVVGSNVWKEIKKIREAK